MLIPSNISAAMTPVSTMQQIWNGAQKAWLLLCKKHYSQTRKRYFFFLFFGGGGGRWVGVVVWESEWAGNTTISLLQEIKSCNMRDPQECHYLNSLPGHRCSLGYASVQTLHIVKAELMPWFLAQTSLHWTDIPATSTANEAAPLPKLYPQPAQTYRGHHLSTSQRTRHEGIPHHSPARKRLKTFGFPRLPVLPLPAELQHRGQRRRARGSRRVPVPVPAGPGPSWAWYLSKLQPGIPWCLERMPSFPLCSSVLTASLSSGALTKRSRSIAKLT